MGFCSSWARADRDNVRWYERHLESEGTTDVPEWIHFVFPRNDSWRISGLLQPAIRQGIEAAALARILADEAPVVAVAVAAGAAAGCWPSAPGRAGMRPARPPTLLRAAGLDAAAAQSADAAVDGPLPGEGGVLLAFTHTRRQALHRAGRARARARRARRSSRSPGSASSGADLVTVQRERSSAYTASHLGALLRAAQLARALGADLPGLAEVPGGRRPCLPRPARRAVTGAARSG